MSEGHALINFLFSLSPTCEIIMYFFLGTNCYKNFSPWMVLYDDLACLLPFIICCYFDITLLLLCIFTCTYSLKY